MTVLWYDCRCVKNDHVAWTYWREFVRLNLPRCRWLVRFPNVFYSGMAWDRPKCCSPFPTLVSTKAPAGCISPVFLPYCARSPGRRSYRNDGIPRAQRSRRLWTEWCTCSHRGSKTCRPKEPWPVHKDANRQTWRWSLLSVRRKRCTDIRMIVRISTTIVFYLFFYSILNQASATMAISF